MEQYKYSVVIPVYNEEQMIDECWRRIAAVMDQTGESYEIIFINDGSVDNTRALCSAICERSDNVRLLNFSRNFGHQVAITAGTDFAVGDAIIIIDADLQDPPEVILEFIAKWKEGYDVVYGKRSERLGETWFKKTTAAGFYRVLNRLTDVPIPMDVGDFRLIDRKVKEALSSLGEKNRFVRGMVSWVGFKQVAVEYVRQPRYAGETKYPLSKMVRFATNAIISFSYKPLRLAIYLGIFTSFAGFLYLLRVLYQGLFTETTVPGWASVMAVTLIANGVILFVLGIIGEYIGRIFDESKARPLYIIESKAGYSSDNVMQRHAIVNR